MTNTDHLDLAEAVRVAVATTARKYQKNWISLQSLEVQDHLTCEIQNELASWILEQKRHAFMLGATWVKRGYGITGGQIRMEIDRRYGRPEDAPAASNPDYRHKKTNQGYCFYCGVGTWPVGEQCEKHRQRALEQTALTEDIVAEHAKSVEPPPVGKAKLVHQQHSAGETWCMHCGLARNLWVKDAECPERVRLRAAMKQASKAPETTEDLNDAYVAEYFKTPTIEVRKFLAEYQRVAYKLAYEELKPLFDKLAEVHAFAWTDLVPITWWNCPARDKDIAKKFPLPTVKRARTITVQGRECKVVNGTIRWLNADHEWINVNMSWYAEGPQAAESLRAFADLLEHPEEEVEAE